MRLISVCALVWVASVAGVATQSSRPATAAITGVVLDGGTGSPIEGALVYLVRDGSPVSGRAPRQLTDAQGRFAFTQLLPSDSYTLTASRAGYFASTYGRDFNTGASPARPITLTDGQWFAGARVTMWKSSAIAGVVTDEAGEPVVNAFVRVLPLLRIAGRDHLAAGTVAITDDRGAYRLAGLMPGRYLVQVPSVQATALASSGDAAVGGVPPQLEASMRASGRQPPLPMALDHDPLGRLIIGRYAVPPPPVDGRLMVYPITFHPNVTAVEHATVIEVGAGQDRTAIDIRLTPVPTTRISGTVDGPADALRSLVLRLLPAGLEDLGIGSEAGVAAVAPDGSFVFLNVPIGSYTIDASRYVSQYSLTTAGVFSGAPVLPASPGQPQSWSSNGVEAAPPGTSFMVQSAQSSGATMFGQRSIVVDGPPQTGVVVTLREPGTLTGRVVVEQDPKSTAKPPESFPIVLEPANGSPRLGKARNAPRALSGLAPDELSIENVLPGQYLLRSDGYREWVIKSVAWQGRDYLDLPFDAAATQHFTGVVVTMTNALPTITGVVRDDRGVTDAAVIVFPANPNGWRNYGLSPPRIESAMAGADGRYSIRTPPAGEYFVIAVARRFVDAWLDPVFLKTAAPLAQRIQLRWGETTSQDLRVQEVR